MSGVDLDKINKVHFVGIGGIGVSAIARLFLRQGKQVTGSDQSLDSPIVSEIKRAGAVIYKDHRARQVPREAELLIYSLAIPESNPERQAAARRGLPERYYPEVIGLV